MRILSLDLATSTGWYATGEGGGAHNWSSLLQAKIHKTDRHKAIFGRFQRWLADAVVEYQPTIIVIENPPPTLRGAAAQILIGLRACTLTIAYLHDLLVDEIPSTEWQAWAKPRGWIKSDAEDARFLHDFYMAERLDRIVASEARHVAA